MMILYVQLQSGPPLDEMSIACISRDLLHAVEYLHNEGKIHRDIKGCFSSSDPLICSASNYLSHLFSAFI